MATHCSTFARKIAWTEEPGGLQSMGSHSQTRLSMHAQTSPFKMKNTSTELNTILVEFHLLEYPNILLGSPT